MTVHVVGIGLDGAAGLGERVLQIVEQATLLVGSDRHLSYFPDHPAERIVLGDFTAAIAQIRKRYPNDLGSAAQDVNVENHPGSELPFAAHQAEIIVVLVTGDPLFFGLGRLLLAELPRELLQFHPHLSSAQLAFNRLKIPWQDARTISVHGRSLDELIEALRHGGEKIAVLTDGTNSPAAIARLLNALDLTLDYELWVCENLGSDHERLQSWPIRQRQDLQRLAEERFAPLNVVVLLRQSVSEVRPLDLASLPLLGIPDRNFLSFSDRPGLMTKREVRLLILGELALQPRQVIWDIGAGTGSVSIEIARLFPDSQIYAIEKTDAGTSLIEQNCQRFQVKNVVSIHGKAPQILERLPRPERVFIGGSGGNLRQILSVCAEQLAGNGVIVLALATLEHLNIALSWVKERSHYEWGWHYQFLQAQLSRSVPVAELTRFAPLNPVTILSITRQTLA